MHDPWSRFSVGCNNSRWAANDCSTLFSLRPSSKPAFNLSSQRIQRTLPFSVPSPASHQRRIPPPLIAPSEVPCGDESGSRASPTRPISFAAWDISSEPDLGPNRRRFQRRCRRARPDRTRTARQLSRVVFGHARRGGDRRASARRFQIYLQPERHQTRERRPRRQLAGARALQGQHRGHAQSAGA